ncbi:hypothetical protein TWF696_009596 [Orbilia brochopaga]|uniref:F-box domain-containing protein n=1 Tax=Orbilia brochopaga TaxID=3140254 RepID=A0AAV9UFH5_9PEZI
MQPTHPLQHIAVKPNTGPHGLKMLLEIGNPKSGDKNLPAAPLDTLQNNLCLLPRKVLDKIIAFLPNADISSLSRANKFLESICSSILYRSRVVIEVREHPDQVLLFSPHPPSWYHIRDLSFTEPPDTREGWIDAFPTIGSEPDHAVIDHAMRKALSDMEGWLLSKIPQGCLKELRYIVGSSPRRIYVPLNIMECITRFSNLTSLDLPFFDIDYDIVDLPTSFFPFLRIFRAHSVSTDTGMEAVSRIIKDAKRLCEFFISWDLMNLSRVMEPSEKFCWLPNRTMAEFANEEIYRPLVVNQSLRKVEVHKGARLSNLVRIVTNRTVKEVTLAEMQCPEIFSDERIREHRIHLTHLSVSLRCNIDCGFNTFKFLDNLLPGLETFRFVMRPTIEAVIAFDNGVNVSSNVNCRNQAHQRWWDIGATDFLERHKATLKHLTVLAKPQVWMPGFVSTRPWEWAVKLVKPPELESMSFTWHIESVQDTKLNEMYCLVEQCFDRIPLLSSLKSIYIVADCEKMRPPNSQFSSSVASLIAHQIGKNSKDRPRVERIGVETAWSEEDVYGIAWLDDENSPGFIPRFTTMEDESGTPTIST